MSEAHAPGSGEELAKLLREHTAARSPLFVRGGGSRSGIGNLRRGVGARLETHGLAGIDELDRSEGVVRAGAGTPLAELAAAAADAGWELPLDPPGSGATLGGVLAAAASGPRFPEPRAAVLGMTVALATGERARSGGRVVKNVTGYDLAKLHVGSFGSFGVIESVWLRLRPRPERVRVLVAELEDPRTRFGLALAAGRRGTARVAVLQGARLVLELAGDAAAVDADTRLLDGALPVAEADSGSVEAARAWAGEGCSDDDAPGALALRASVLPSAAEAANARLGGLGAETLVHPVRGLVYARIALPPDATVTESLAELFAGARAAALARIGFLRIEAAPDWIKHELDVFFETPQAVGLLRALKRQFDPAGILNPGRFAGAL